MKKFEYKVVPIATSIAIGTKGYEKAASEFENQLNKLGEEGWELVQRTDGFFSLREK